MPTELTDAQLDELKALLQQQHQQLRDEVRQALIDSGNEQNAYMTEGAHDAGDDSVADQLASLNLDMLDRHVRELRELEAALARIDDGSYGECIDDGAWIGYQRLKANPTAQRCIDCQERFERTHAQPGRPKL